MAAAEAAEVVVVVVVVVAEEEEEEEVVVEEVEQAAEAVATGKPAWDRRRMKRSPTQRQTEPEARLAR